MDVRGKGKGHAVPARNSCVRATACGRLHVGGCVWETACGRLGRSHPILRGLPPFIITATVMITQATTTAPIAPTTNGFLFVLARLDFCPPGLTSMFVRLRPERPA